jgi:hypothetical protein
MKFHKGQLRKHNILTLVLVLFISNCRSTPENLQQLPVTSTPYPAPTAVVNTPTSLPVSSPTLFPSPTITIEDRCLSVEESLPPDFQLEGVWVRQETNPYLEIIKENTKYRVPFDGGERLYNSEGYWSVSPNGEWLAYINTVYDTTGISWRKKGDLLKVIHSSGYFLTMDYWPMTYQSIQGWIDDKNLLINMNQRFIVLNPFSGSWHELKDPDWLTNLTINKHQEGIVEYSPHLDSVILRSKNQVELRDTVSGKTLFEDDKFDLSDEFAWSPDAVMLAISTNDGNVIHVFQNSEEILTLDFLNNKSLTSSLGSGLSSIVKLEWSLNNQRLLIVPISGNILLLDPNEQKLYKICFDKKGIHEKHFPGNFFYLQTGQYIVVSVYIRDYKDFDVLIDTMTMSAYSLPTSNLNGRIGWLALPELTEK